MRHRARRSYRASRRCSVAVALLLAGCGAGASGRDAPRADAGRLDAAPHPGATADARATPEPDAARVPARDAGPRPGPDAAGRPDADVDAAGLVDAGAQTDARPAPAADAAGVVADAGPDPLPPLPWNDDPCATLDVGDDPFAAVVRAFAAEDDAAPPPPGGLVVAGSSTIRRWASAQRVLSPWDPVQRGLGGARLADLAHHAEALILRHAPAGVVVFAGTNDLADGRSIASVVDAWRCLATRLQVRSPGVPLLYVSITPTPARWAIWASADAVNRQIAALAAAHPSLHFVDTTPAFLATGAPPAARLFVEDGLHLSTEGYALFERAVVEAVDAAVPRPAGAPPEGPPPGSYLRVDLGPENPEDGRPAPARDAFGIVWNAWRGAVGGEQVLAGRALRGLVTTTGRPTPASVVVAGGFRANGLRDGGLTAPRFEDLGTLAVPEATGDFFYTEGPDDPGALTLGGLSPGATHTLRLFASRLSPDEVRRTGFVVHGADPDAPAVGSVTTTGDGIGFAGADGNTGTLVLLSGLRPDARGRLHVDVRIEAGRFAYLNLLEIEVEGAAPRR